MDEELVWEGTPSQMVNAQLFTVCLLLAWLLVPLAVAGRRFLETRFTHYALSRERLDVTTGVLSRRTGTLELYRVKDLGVEEPVWLRLAGLGNLVVHSSDRSHPVLVLQGIADPRLLRDRIRGLVEKQRDRKGVREVDV